MDDQPAWLDSNSIGYAIPRDIEDSNIWAADGSGSPWLLIPHAGSPAALG
ncbi:hypothetical protein [Nocardia araoensis]|nr:hypothetical protein [Nocardia araoensis]